MSVSVEQPLVQAQNEEAEVYDFQPLTNILNQAHNFYKKFPQQLRFAPVENAVGKIPLTQMTQFADQKVSQTINMVKPIKEHFVKRSQNFKENIIHRSKNNAFVKKADSLSVSILEHLENQVQFLEELIQKNSNNAQNLDDSQLEQNKNLKTNPFAPLDEKPQSEDLNITERTRKLAQRVNNVSVLLAQTSFGYLRGFKLIDQAANMYSLVQKKGTQFQKLVQVHIQVAYELTWDYLNECVVRKIQQNLLLPAQEIVKVKYNEAQEKVILTYQNVKQSISEQLIPLINDKYQILKDQVVYFKDNVLHLVINKEFYQKYYQQIKEASHKLYEEIENIKKNLTQKVQNLYQVAIEEYRRRVFKKCQQSGIECSEKLLELEGFVKVEKKAHGHISRDDKQEEIQKNDEEINENEDEQL